MRVYQFRHPRVLIVVDGRTLACPRQDHESGFEREVPHARPMGDTRAGGFVLQLRNLARRATIRWPYSNGDGLAFLARFVRGRTRVSRRRP